MIDSNNKLNSLSKSLIDSVRGIMEGKKLDPVGKEDGDIDNDGDVDSSDKYLHNRRKTIKHAMKKEEVDQIDELSKDTLSRYTDKAAKERDDAHAGRNDSEEGARKYFNRKNGVRKALEKTNEDVEINEATLSAKAGREGKDLGKPGKNFSKIAKTAGEKYGSKEAGLRVAGAVLKKMRNEEVEELDELSRATLGRYGQKAKSIADNEGGKDRTAGRELAGRKKWGGSMKGVDPARVPATNEEVEELDELKGSTVKSYIKKATADKNFHDKQMHSSDKEWDPAAGKFKARNEFDNKAKYHTKELNKRNSGLKRAYDKMAEEVELDEALDAAARYGDHHTAIKSLLKSIGEHIEHHKKDALAHKDYRGKKGVNWSHVGDVAQVHAQLADVHDRLAQQGEYAKSMKEDLDEDLTLEDIEQIDELSKDAMLKYLSANKKDDRKAQAAGDMDKMTKRMRGTDMAVRKYTAKPGSKYVKVPATEEVDLDESPVDGVAPGSMANDGHLCATKVFHKEWAEGTPIFSQHAEPDADGNIAWYDVMFEHGIEKMVSTDDLDILMSESHERHGKKMKEEIDSDLEAELKAQRQTKKSVEDAKKKYGVKEETEELDEARGRPRKNPQPEGQSDEPEPRQHIIQQLQRAKLSMRGGEHVTFKNGEKHLVHGSHAAKLLNRYAGMKPNEKEDFQKKIGASHESLKSEL